jgi:hypothetical protein
MGSPEVSAIEIELAEQLMVAAQKGNLQAVRKVLDQCGQSEGETSTESEERMQRIVNFQDQDGWSALHYASHMRSSQHTLVIKELCKCNADTNLRDRRGWGPLHVAAQFAEPASITALVHGHADRRMKDNSDMTPLDCANGQDRRMLLQKPGRVITYLLEKGNAMLVQAERYSDKDITYIDELAADMELQVQMAEGDLSVLTRKVQQEKKTVSFTGGLLDGVNQYQHLWDAEANLKVEEDRIHQVKICLNLLHVRAATDHTVKLLVEVLDKIDYLQEIAEADPPSATRSRSIVYLTGINKLSDALQDAKSRTEPPMSAKTARLRADENLNGSHRGDEHVYVDTKLTNVANDVLSRLVVLSKYPGDTDPATYAADEDVIRVLVEPLRDYDGARMSQVEMMQPRLTSRGNAPCGCTTDHFMPCKVQ